MHAIFVNQKVEIGFFDQNHAPWQTWKTLGND
jgi:hypothetical protein